MKTIPFDLTIKSAIIFFVIILHQTLFAQSIMFDDFSYTNVDDPQLTTFNKWEIVNGIDGPPSDAQYNKNNIVFISDPANPGNKWMNLSTTVNGKNKATTHSRIQTAGYDYFEGTYAARVYFSETPLTYKDGNVQTFYTIVSHELGGDGSKYSELDVEYMAADKWGISPDKQVLYMTSWNRYIPEPWQAWKRYFSSQKSWEGWHTFVISCTDGKNVKYWADGEYFGAMATTDNDGSSVYPRSNMQIAFANWIWNHVTGSSTEDRKTTMQVDWVLHVKDTELAPEQVEGLITEYRSKGIQRKNMAGENYIGVTGVDKRPTHERFFTSYPNPVKDKIFFKGIEEGSTVVIYDVYDKKVFETSLSNYQINISSLNRGLYKLVVKKENRNILQKIIKN